ncbi:hypothetical protein N8768_07260 [Flavobacteriaceae bacterium]|nr:hypothetical protein [Flavobacteriaceae bacterium]
MKKVFKKSLLFIIMINLMVTYAHSKVHKNESDERQTSINFDRVKKGQKLIIKSKEGTIIYKELLDKSGTYRKEFDLTSLPNGHYYFELDKDLEIQIIPFNVQNTKVNFKKENAQSIFKPIVTTRENVVSINKLSLNLEPLEINIYYNSGNNELIHTEKIKDKNNIQRVYRLLKSENGKYKIVCTTQGRTFTTFFEF